MVQRPNSTSFPCLDLAQNISLLPGTLATHRRPAAAHTTSEANRRTNSMSSPVRISYWVVAVAFIVVAWLQMTSAMLAVFFCYFAITKLHFGKSRWLAVVLFCILLSGIGYALVH